MDAVLLEEAPASVITIAGAKLSVHEPFKEGHVLSSNEASAMNQTYKENIRNNTSPRITKAKEEGATDDVLQQIVKDYEEDYEFGTRRGGGGRTADPVAREAHSLAMYAVKSTIREKGLKISDFDSDALNALVARALESHPEILERAKANVQATQEALDSVDIALEA